MHLLDHNFVFFQMGGLDVLCVFLCNVRDFPPPVSGTCLTRNIEADIQPQVFSLYLYNSVPGKFIGF